MESTAAKELLNDAKDFYCRAMMCGYLGDAERKKTPLFRNHTYVEYEEGPWRFLDFWNDEGGFTRIFYENKPFWWMNYGGDYPADIIDFLKASLTVNYTSNVFRGGRGPASHIDGEHSYFNDARGTFSGFHGTEWIEYKHVDSKSTIHRGGHWYSGGLFPTHETL